MRTMWNLLKAALVSLVVITLVYAGTVAYVAYTIINDEPYYDLIYQPSRPPPNNGYPAFLYNGTPTGWYTPEQLGIYALTSDEEGDPLIFVLIDKDREPFPLMDKQPIFLYKDKFYRVSALWVTPGLRENNLSSLLFVIGLVLVPVWGITILSYIEKKKQSRR